MNKKYNKREYLKYVKELREDLLPAECAIDFKTWKWIQPIGDRAVGLTNSIVRKHIKK